MGLIWLALTVIFELGLGRFGLGYSWQWLAEDYDLSRGGLMAFGLALMTLVFTESN